MSMLGSSVATYVNDLRPIRPGKAPRRSPVVKLGATEAELRHQSPGPGTYSPQEVHKRGSAWSMSDRHAVRESVDRSPGPIYMMRSSMDVQPSSMRQTAPRFGFGTGTRPDAVKIAKLSQTPGPGTYYDPNAGIGAAAIRSPRSSRAKEPTYKELDRSLGGPTEGPGPAAYSPRLTTSDKRAAPAYTMRSVAGHPDSLSDSPGPAMYTPRSKSRYGGGHIGDAPSFSISQREASLPHSSRFISKEHSHSQQGLHSPGPASYTPREMVGVVDYTNSNTSRHAPMFTFGSERRFDAAAPAKALAARPVAKAQPSTFLAYNATPAPRASPRQ